ncbi:MAG: prepilin-type N-terminal cleavage/methylation domain-containing protein [Candidatus Pacebacteria bacterium]|nr:prepilin-type N-terminal cleavage/methylation domain-containing protein [Candidatus Paceibacterota bacterium]
MSFLKRKRNIQGKKKDLISNPDVSVVLRVRGFTVVEIMVVIAIALVLMGALFSSQRDYEDTILLKNSAYETALFLREAQAYATGVRLLAQAGPDEGRYGVHIDLGSPTSLYLYKDGNVTENGVYDIGEEIREMDLVSPFYIRSFCTEGENVVLDCFNMSGELDILFVRPDPKPVFFTNGTQQDVSKVSIKISTPTDKTFKITSFKVGHMSVE